MKLNFEALAGWPEIADEEISNNGKYVLYTVTSEKAGSSLFIQSNDNLFKKSIPNPKKFGFTMDSRQAIYINQGDSLCIMDLGTGDVLIIPAVQSFGMPKDGDGQWLAYLLASGDLVLQDLHSGEKNIYPRVEVYEFSKTGKTLILTTANIVDTAKPTTLQRIDLQNGKISVLWRGKKFINFVFDSKETGLAFITGNGSLEHTDLRIGLYQPGMDSARILVEGETPGIEKVFCIADNELTFSPDDRMLFFSIHLSPVPSIADPKKAQVDIWNYKDEFIQPEQLEMLQIDRNHSFRAVVHIGDENIIRLEQNQDGLWGNYRLNDGGNDDYLLTETKVNLGEGYRKPYERPDIYLINTSDGSRHCIKKELINGDPHFSPAGRYVFWYDMKKKSYYTYTIETGVTKNISIGINFPLYEELWDLQSFPSPYNPMVWLENDQALLVYDRYDIWQLDPKGVKQPINVTNGYGRKNKTVLRYVYVKGRNLEETQPVKNNDTLLLCGFSQISRYNGFFKKKLAPTGDPVKLIMAPNAFYFPVYADVGLSDFIKKAKDASTYLLKRMSPTEYPNLQITKDFIEFKSVSELQPQKPYNWLTTEMVHWKTFDGRPGEGILYKPENFDPQKKYPIIFYFYERLSAGLNKFIAPGLSIGPINIPWFVSHGYLVFCPDIQYTVGEPGESAYNYVVSAAKMMNQKSWVDGKRMGIQGHSWGGYEVNYLVTRTGLFAAAASAAGPSDWVSDYGSLIFNAIDTHSFLEQAQPRMGVTLWQNPQAYIKNSPVFGADKITTPLLMIHNKKDGNVPWSQGVEFFTSLRRLDKKVWMLTYDEGNHQLEMDHDNRDPLDYTIRLEQFFDHYLKGEQAPVWMTRGVSASLKGIDTGLELDLTGKQP